VVEAHTPRDCIEVRVAALTAAAAAHIARGCIDTADAFAVELHILLQSSHSLDCHNLLDIRRAWVVVPAHLPLARMDRMLPGLDTAAQQHTARSLHSVTPLALAVEEDGSVHSRRGNLDSAGGADMLRSDSMTSLRKPNDCLLFCRILPDVASCQQAGR